MPKISEHLVTARHKIQAVRQALANAPGIKLLVYDFDMTAQDVAGNEILPNAPGRIGVKIEDDRLENVIGAAANLVTVHMVDKFPNVKTFQLTVTIERNDK